jgi:uncharacterized membrane protein YkvA (DUF1232 family)
LPSSKRQVLRKIEMVEIPQNAHEQELFFSLWQQVLKTLSMVGQEAVTLVMELYDMMKAHFTGSRHLSAAFVLAIIGALIYLVDPMDLIPDWIPFVGYLDDIAVLKFVFANFMDEIIKFRRWRNDV